MPHIKNGPADNGRAGCAIGRRTQTGPTAKDDTSQSPCWLIHERFSAEHPGHEWTTEKGRLDPDVGREHVLDYAFLQLAQLRREVTLIRDRLEIDPKDDVVTAIEAVENRASRAQGWIGEFVTPDIGELENQRPRTGLRGREPRFAGRC